MNALKLLFALCVCWVGLGNVATAQATKQPVIYSTDLWLPHGDPDDHFDLLSLLSVPQLDPKAIILDHTMQSNVKRTGVDKQPNFQVVEKAIKLFGRKSIPARSGLKEPLKDVTDQGEDRAVAEQAAIELILEQLAMVADNSAIIITTGSVRDVVAAFNRKPGLFKDKVRNIFISMGDSYGITGTLDTNVAKDIEAWKGLMQSGLPISWMPTNPSKRRGGASRYVSYWHFVQEELLYQAPKSIQDFFLSEGIPLALPQSRPVRSMWSTPAFIEAAGLQCYRTSEGLKWMPAGLGNPSELCKPYSFVPIQFSIDEQGMANWKEVTSLAESNMRIFKVEDYYLYNEAMTAFVSTQLAKAKN